MNKKDQIGECPHCHGRNTAVIVEQILSEGWTEHKLAKIFVCYECGKHWSEKYRLFYEGYSADGENFDEYGQKEWKV